MQYTGKKNTSYNASMNATGSVMRYDYDNASSRARSEDLGIDDEFPSVANLLANASEALAADVTGWNRSNDKLSVKTNNDASEYVTGRHNDMYDDDDMTLFREYDELLRIADLDVDDKYDSAPPKPSAMTSYLGSMYRNDEWGTTNAPKRVRNARSRARKNTDSSASTWLDDGELLREIDSIIADDERLTGSIVDDDTRAIAVGIVDGTSQIYADDTSNVSLSSSKAYVNNGATRYQSKRNVQSAQRVKLDAQLPDPRVETISDIGGAHGIDNEYVSMLEEYDDLDDQLFDNDTVDKADGLDVVDNDDMEKTRVIASGNISSSLVSDNVLDDDSSRGALNESRGDRASGNKRASAEHGEWLDARRDAITSIYGMADTKFRGEQRVTKQESRDAEPDLTGGWDAVRTGELWDNWYAAVNTQAERIEHENGDALESVTTESAGGVLPVIEGKKRNKSGVKRAVLFVTAIVLMIGGSLYALRASGLLDWIIGSILG